MIDHVVNINPQNPPRVVHATNCDMLRFGGRFVVRLHDPKSKKHARYYFTSDDLRDVQAGMYTPRTGWKDIVDMSVRSHDDWIDWVGDV